MALVRELPRLRQGVLKDLYDLKCGWSRTIVLLSSLFCTGEIYNDTQEALDCWWRSEERRVGKECRL